MRKLLALAAAVAMLSACGEKEPEHHTGLTGRAIVSYEIIEEDFSEMTEHEYVYECRMWETKRNIWIGSYREHAPTMNIEAVIMAYDDHCEG
jgi:hypothetical protein